MDDSTDREGAIDLNHCDREPIHVPGRIQSHGFLLALTPDWRITHASVNIGDYTGVAAEGWLGHSIDALLDPDAIHALRNRAASLHGPDAIQRSFSLALFTDKPAFDVAVHVTTDAIIIEAEPAVRDDREAVGLVRAMVARLKHADGLEAFFRDGARHVQALIGFDRVMVYRFDTDGHGEVIAEAVRGKKDRYLGFHYPASDIPQQARALYLRSPFRIIADVQADTVPILALPETVVTLDQSLSILRSVSPVHIEYLKNMGVAASLSISIIVNGKLWGLFACHHQVPILPSFAYRTAAELFGEMYSMMLESRLQRDLAEHELRDRAAAALLIAEMDHDSQLLTNPRRLGELLFETIPADGLCIHLDGSVWLTGQTPDETQCGAVAIALSERKGQMVFATDALATALPESLDCGGDVAGLIAIPLMRHPTDYLLLFRCERVRTLQWAGNPDKGETPVSTTTRMSPRRSFAAWSEDVRGRCEPFTVAQLHAAETMRVALLEAILRSNAGISQTPPLVRDSQDMLIAELNHRVRNILALIRGLISQTRSSVETADGFMSTLDERVQSLARAHDQITTERWGPARLKDLIDTEADAYLGVKSSRVETSGTNIMIHPQAFTTLALVFHELMTNAAKYGALSDGGAVSVEWQLEGQGDLLIQWVERDGPPVRAPTRHGFGSTIIDRSIPFDLGGTAKSQYLSAGFEAQFTIPAMHLAGISAVEAPAQLTAFSNDAKLLEGLTVLLVEDNMIIAMDCEETLRGLGAATVVTAASVREALAAIEHHDFRFALLDFNLGLETSMSVADVLSQHGVPYAFATGFDGEIQSGGKVNAPVIGKPYGKKQLMPLLVKLGFHSA